MVKSGALNFCDVAPAGEFHSGADWMLFGHNTNVTVGDVTYHVQTEDRGSSHALIDTTVHCRGRVMHRRTNNYFDLLPLDADREQALKVRLEDQHRVVIDEMRSGTLHLPPLPPEPPPRNRNAAAEDEARQKQTAPPTSPLAQPHPLKLELLNAKTWLAGKRAVLQISVQDGAGNPLSAVLLSAHVEGAASPEEFAVRSGANGHARLEFDMPRLAGGEAALVIEASHGDAHGQLRFSLRARPKVPAAS